MSKLKLAVHLLVIGTMCAVIVATVSWAASWWREHPSSDQRIDLAVGVKHAGTRAGIYHKGIVRSKKLDVFLKERREYEAARTREIEECRRGPVCALTMKDLVRRRKREIWTPGSGFFTVTWSKSGKRGAIEWMSHEAAYKKFYSDDDRIPEATSRTRRE